MNNTKRIFLFILFVLISIGIGSYVKAYREDLLNGSTKESTAIFDHTSVVYNTGPISYFEHTVNGETIYFEIVGRFDSLKKGDTVRIEYSIKDPTVAKIIE